MSIAATSWAWKQTCGSPGCKLVLLACADFADHRGVCWPSMKALGISTCQSPASVARRLGKLEAAGLISRSPRQNAMGGTMSGLIRLHMDGASSGGAR